MFYENCLIGASAFSIGFALTHEDTVILEPSENVFSDFVNTINYCKVGKPVSDAGKKFYGFLKDDGYISKEGFLDTPSFATGGADFVNRNNLNILLGAKLICATENCVTVYTNSGIRKIECERIINLKENKSEKVYNCIVFAEDKEAVKRFPGKYIKSYAENEYIFSLRFDEEATVNEARIEFENIFKNIYPKNEVLLGYFADSFDYEHKYPDLLSEFEAGVEL